MADRTLGAFLTTLLMVGAMIGSGIFFLPASLGAVGSIAMLSWIAATLGALLIAGVFAALAVLRPAADGLFAYVEQGLGRGAGFVVGLVYWISAWIGATPLGVAIAGYASYFLPRLAHPPWPSLVACLFTWLLIGVVAIGPRLVARLSGVTLLLGLIPVVLVATLGWLAFSPAIFLRSWNVSGQSLGHVVPATTATVFFGFLGMEIASVVARAVRNPARDIPIAALGGVLIAGVIYILASAAIMGMMPARALAASSAPFADALRPFIGALAAGLVAAAALIRAFGGLGAALLVAVESAQSGAVLGQVIGARSTSRCTNLVSLALIGVLCCGLIVASAGGTLARQFTLLVDLSVVTTMTTYLAAGLALIRLAAGRRLPQALGLAAASFSAWVIASSEPKLLLGTLCLFAAATLAYLPIRWRRRLESV